MCYINKPGNLKSDENMKKCNFKIWFEKYARILFVMYAVTKDMKNIEILIQHR